MDFFHLSGPLTAQVSMKHNGPISRGNLWGVLEICLRSLLNSDVKGVSFYISMVNGDGHQGQRRGDSTV